MRNVNVERKFGQVDYSKINTEEDCAAEACRLLPEAMENYGKAIATTMWENGLSNLIEESKRATFILEKTDEISRSRQAQEEVEAAIIRKISEGKAAQPDV